MANSRRTLQQIGPHLEESMGVRRQDPQLRLSPVASPKDVGRRPLRGFGQLEIHLLAPDPDQPRKDFSEESVRRLAQSLRDKGQMFPIRVRWAADQQRWIIISGERRWRAAQAAGLQTIDCYFHEAELSESELLEQQLVENLLREDLRPMEEARAFASLLRLNGWTGKQLATALHIAESKVSRALALLQLPEGIQRQVDAGEVAARSAYELTKLSDETTQKELASRAAAGKLTHKQAANLVRRRRGGPKKWPQSTKLTFLAENGWNVVVSADKKGTYHDVEQALEHALEDVRLRIQNSIHLSY